MIVAVVKCFGVGFVRFVWRVWIWCGWGSDIIFFAICVAMWRWMGGRRSEHEVGRLERAREGEKGDVGTTTEN